MVNSKWMAGAGLAAMLGGALAIILTAPFATAYFRAYPGFDVPPVWLPAAQAALHPVLTFASPVVVYNVYGRIFDLVYLLSLPAVFALHDYHRPVSRRMEQWAFGLLVIGWLAAFIGVAGDYWADGAGFIIELLGLLILALGTTLYGVAALRSQVMPSWCAGLLIAGGPAALVFFPLIGHIPSGPTLPLAICWLTVGGLVWFNHGRPSPRPGYLSKHERTEGCGRQT